MLSFFLAKRFFRGSSGKSRASAPATRIATAGIAIGLAVMIGTVAVVSGFRREIKEKVAGFSAHIEVFNVYSLCPGNNTPAMPCDKRLNGLLSVEGVTRIQPVATKMGVLKTNDDFLGLQLKGVDASYDTAFLAAHLLEGRLPRLGTPEGDNEILLSQMQARLLGLKLNDRVYAYFFEEQVRVRRFTIVGLYETHLTQFDKNLAVTTLHTVQVLNGWSEEQCGSLEVYTNHFDNDERLRQTVYRIDNLLHGLDEEGAVFLTAITVKERYPSIFAWLGLFDTNVAVILIIMVVLSSLTMISGLLILILERVQTIGILKALGAGNTQLRHTFLTLASFIVVRGLIIGNVVALLLLAVQNTWGVVHLDADIYYVDRLPVEVVPWHVLWLNVGTLVVTVLALLLPSYMISRIQPAKAIRFE